MILSEKISALRKQKGLSQDDLAIMMNITRQAVSRWEQGESIPDIDNLVRLSEIFDVTTDYLLKNGASALQQSNAEKDVAIDFSNDRYEKSEQRELPWIYQKFFANHFIYIVVLGIYVAIGFMFGIWRFAWPIFVLIWIVEWAIESWYGIEDEDDC